LREPEIGVRPRMRFPAMKVIFMPGYSESALVQEWILSRNTVLLQKPSNAKKILEVIHQMSSQVQA